MNSQDISLILKNPATTVVFTKKDGTERTMICTNNLEYIPKKFHPKPKEEEVEAEIAFVVNKVVKPEDPDLHKVFDLESLGWRSFRTEQVKSITIHG